MRQGSAPNFAPPVEEGMVYSFEDEKGDVTELEFLGLILHDEGDSTVRRYGFFYTINSEQQVGGSGEVVELEVTELDDEGQPAAFELVEDEAIAEQIYREFQEATKDLYDFE